MAAAYLDIYQSSKASSGSRGDSGGRLRCYSDLSPVSPLHRIDWGRAEHQRLRPCPSVPICSHQEKTSHIVALEGLLAKVLPDLSSKDVLVFLGDYIDKGRDIRGCVDCIIRLREKAPCPVVALLGDHEQYMLRTWKDPTSHSWLWAGGF